MAKLNWSVCTVNRGTSASLFHINFVVTATNATMARSEILANHNAVVVTPRVGWCEIKVTLCSQKGEPFWNKSFNKHYDLINQSEDMFYLLIALLCGVPWYSASLSKSVSQNVLADLFTMFLVTSEIMTYISILVNMYSLVNRASLWVFVARNFKERYLNIV